MTDTENQVGNPALESPLDEVEEYKAPLIEHIVELRRRLLYMVAALVTVFIVCFVFSEDIYDLMAQPLADLPGAADRKLIFTGLTEALFTYINLSFWAALLITSPFIIGQIYLFIAPGLYKNERKAFFPFLAVTPVLFLLGAALVYYVIMPNAWEFLLGFEKPAEDGSLAVKAELKVNEYLSLVMKLIFAFGLCFQLPVLLTLMARVGLATSAGLAAKRKYSVILTFVVAAVLTPPDPFSQISLALPILLLYEISIICARIVEKKRAEKEASGEY